MTTVATALESLDTLDLAQSTAVMDAFAKKLEDMEIIERTVGNALEEDALRLASEDDVSNLIQEVADANHLQLQELLPSLSAVDTPADRLIKTSASAVSSSGKARSEAQ